MHKYVATTFKYLNKVIPHKNWFIAGGSLIDNTNDVNINDVDVFFFSKQDFDAAITSISQEIITTQYSASFLYQPLFHGPITVQFIHKSFGSVEEILSNFDLNKSRQALFPNGDTYIHPTFFKDLYVTPERLSICSFDRLTKYITKKNQTLSLSHFKDLVLYIFTSSRLVDDYYTNSQKPMIHMIPELLKFCHFQNLTSTLYDITESFDGSTRSLAYSSIVPALEASFPFNQTNSPVYVPNAPTANVILLQPTHSKELIHYTLLRQSQYYLNTPFQTIYPEYFV